MEKIKVGIIGTGNIGSDLLAKVQKTDILQCGIFAGHNPDSGGIRRAEKMGVPTTIESIHYIEKHPECCEIVFDATSAKVHKYNAPRLKKAWEIYNRFDSCPCGMFLCSSNQFKESFRS